MSHNVVMLVPGVVKVRLNAGLQRRRLAYNGHAGGANRRGHCQTCPCRATTAACRFPQALRGAEIADWAPRADHLRRGNDGIGIDPIVPVEVGDGTRLAEMLDTEWPDAVAVDRAEPCQGRRVAIQHSDNAAISGQTGKQPLDVRAGMDKSTFAGATGRGPARIQ